MNSVDTIQINPSVQNVARFFEFLGFVYAFLPIISVWMFSLDELLGRTASEWTYFALALLPGVFFIFGYRLYLGYYDFRMKVVNHFYVLAITIGTFFFALEPTKIFEAHYIGFLIVLAIIGISIFMLTLQDTTEHLVVIANGIQALSNGNYDFKVEDKVYLNDPVFGIVIQNLNKVITETGALVTNLNATDAIISSTKQLSAISTDISASSEEVASSSQNMAEVANQQAHHVQEIFEKIALLDRTINDVIEQITNNSQVVSQIALQTNILALNAGIEASRAGDYGRGFTVVANNVRKLSEESKAAAENIISVSHIVSETLQSTFSVIRDKIEDISALSEETAASSEEVASVAEEMTSAMEELNQSTAHLADLANNILIFMEENNLTKLLEKGN